MSDMQKVFEEIDTLIESGNHGAVEKRFTELLADYEAGASDEGTDEESRNGLIMVLNEQASWYRNISRFSDSEHSFSRVLELLEAGGEQDSSAYARTLLNIAGVYRLTGRLQQALDAVLKALAIISAEDPRDDYAYATALNTLTLAYQGVGDMDAAERVALESLDFVWVDPVAGDHEIATALSNLANIKIAKGDFDRARELLEEALEIHAKMEKENIHHGALLAAMASLNYREKQFKEAADLLRQSVESTERFFGRNIEFASGHHNLAIVLEASGDFAEAAVSQRIATEVVRALMGSDNARVKEYQEYLEQLETKVAK